jgi:hypothetical protein
VLPKEYARVVLEATERRRVGVAQVFDDLRVVSTREGIFRLKAKLVAVQDEYEAAIAAATVAVQARNDAVARALHVPHPN